MDEEKYYEFVDLYKNPEHHGKPEDYDVAEEEHSSSCGDVFKVYIKMDGGRIKNASFDGSGCIISTVSISTTCGEVIGKTADEVQRMNLDDVKRIVGVDQISLSRIKCATIGLETIKKTLYKLAEKK